MQREIKFRAWDELNEYMFIADGITTAGHPLCYAYNSQADINIPIKAEHLMQFAGLKDKNGVEIYEGDIIDDSFKAVVSFKKGSFIINNNSNKYVKGLLSDYVALRLMAVDGCEVIGNIYEHPELLQQEKGEENGIL